MKPKHLATLITVASLVMAGVHLKWPNLKIDAITLGLLAFAVLPWLRSIIKTVELPGGWKVELQDYSQGTVDEPPPPAHEAQIAINAVAVPAAPPHSLEARKILRTLCHYQSQLFPNEPHKRWTFAVGPRAPDYAAYLRGLAELVTAGLVAVSPENGHALLTNEGIAYCNAHGNELADAGIYAF
jgi:hypothetical protein